MSDAIRREVERRARAGNSLADRVALLRERVRAGVLGLDRLRLAAYLGDEAAAEALAGAPRVVESANGPAVVEVADDATFARVLGAERAVVSVSVPWSGPARSAVTLYRARLAPLLGGLAPGIERYVLALDDVPSAWDWSRRSPLMLGGWGEVLWVCRGRIVEARRPGDVRAPADFVRATVEALGLGLDDA